MGSRSQSGHGVLSSAVAEDGRLASIPGTAGPADLLDRRVDLELNDAPRPQPAVAITEAVILAGGPSGPLNPFAGIAPRHRVPVANEPVLDHLARTLARWGIAETTVVTGAADDGDRDPDACGPGRLVREARFAGTAGALRAAGRHVRSEHFLIVEAGLVTAELDLAAALALHLERGAGLTAIVHRSSREGFAEDLVVSADGQVERWAIPYGSAATGGDLRSSGIYIARADILDLIPDEGHFDLKEQLVPLLRCVGIPVCACQAERVTRIVTLEDYLDANRERLLDGSVPPGGYRESAPGIWVAPGARVAADAELRGPLLIGRDARIEAGASVCGPAAIGDGCTIGRDAVVAGSVLWPNSEIRPATRVEACVVTGAGVLGPAAPIDRGGFRDAARAATKRVVDVTAALGGLLVLWPLMAAAAIAIKLDSPGTVLFRQPRCGRGGRPFTLLKFRTMVADAHQRQADLRTRSDVDGPMFKLYEDPRATRVGRFLRRTNLDELPQLVNVLRGDMSLVGPRPLVMDEMRFAPAWRDARLTVKPGITGLWQSQGHFRPSFADWIRHDIQYVRRQSPSLDAGILLRTVAVALGLSPRSAPGATAPDRDNDAPARNEAHTDNLGAQ